MSTLISLILIIAVCAGIFIWFQLHRGARSLPEQLQAGNQFPEFSALDEAGNAVSTEDLRGSPTVVLFVRGNWCPFCSAQVADLTKHYRDITDTGAKLIIIAPKPLETTQRVADFYNVQFDFWLDADLKIARDFGLLLENAVPARHQEEFGDDTIWPTAVLLDQDNTIIYAEAAKSLRDRPSAAKLAHLLQSRL